MATTWAKEVCLVAAILSAQYPPDGNSRMHDVYLLNPKPSSMLVPLLIWPFCTTQLTAKSIMVTAFTPLAAETMADIDEIIPANVNASLKRKINKREFQRYRCCRVLLEPSVVEPFLVCRTRIA